MARMSPTSRSLKLAREEGYEVNIVERFNAYSKTRIDLFGCIDILAIRDGEILGIQATSADNHSSRVKKAKGVKALTSWLRAGGLFQVWSWGKKGARGKRKLWICRKEEITLESLKRESEEEE